MIEKISWVIGVLRITHFPTPTLSTDQSNRSPGFLSFQLTMTTTWLWRWLPHRLSKRQSLTTVLLRTLITQMIFFSQGMTLFYNEFCGSSDYCCASYTISYLFDEKNINFRVSFIFCYFLFYFSLFCFLISVQVSGLWWQVVKSKLLKVSSFASHRYKLKGSEFYQTTKNDQGVRYTCKKGRAAIFKTQSQRTGSGNGELEILKWGTSKMGNL